MKAQEGKTGQTQTRLSDSERVEQLCEKALKLGATAAAAIPAKDISVDKKFSDMCLKPRCHNYGQSKSCPPHVEGPSAFKKMLENFERAIFFKINVPKEILLSNERLEVFQLLHETASGIEHEAVKAGFTEAKAFAGDPAKKFSVPITMTAMLSQKKESAGILRRQDLQCQVLASMSQY